MTDTAGLTERITLSGVDSNPRNNNFNLLRMLAAWAVLLSHSHFLTANDVKAEPLYEKLGITLGTIAVHCFFVISGFLIARSLLQRQNLRSYALARILRVVPALLIMLLITVFGLGVVLTELPLATYLLSAETWQFFLRNLIMYAGVAWNLPGVFESNPHPFTVNGSLWTIAHEVRFYTVLALVWLFAGLAGNASRIRWLEIFVLLGLLVSGAQILLWHFDLVAERQTARLGFMFLSGVAYQLFSDRIHLDGRLFTLLLLALLAASLHSTAFLVCYLITLPYLLLYLAYIPGGIIRRYNALGDYSYGFYIYAFVVQQTIIWSFPGIDLLALIISSSLATVVLAALSWHYVEQPSLRHKSV